MAILTVLWLLGLLALAAYVAIFAAAGFLLFRYRKSFDGSVNGNQIRFLILVPAHNEGEHLRPTLHSLRALDYPPQQFEVAILADNCTDNTASIAREENCAVWERSDLFQRGKGHALGWALARPQVASYDAVVIIDADTRCSPNLLQAFARELRSEFVPVQARVHFEFPPACPRWLSLTSSAAQSAEELYVSVPRSTLKLYQTLQGTGFCIPAKLLQLVPWSAYSICEDLEYAFQLASKQVAIRFVQDAFVTSSMTGRVEHASEQRRRWARGTYGLIARLFPRQVLRAIANRDWKSLESCFYLATRSRLPLAILTLTSGCALILYGSRPSFSVWVCFALAVALECSYLFAIVSVLRPQHSRTELLVSFLRYSIWITHKHLGALLTLHNTRWNRTERDSSVER